MTRASFSIRSFGGRPGAAHDTTPCVLDALNALRGKRGSTLVFPHGEYHFYASRAAEFLCFTSNNDSGLKRVAIPLVKFHELTIDGQWSRFVFHGEISPFVIEGSGLITLRALSVDWADPRLCQAHVVGAGTRYIDVRMENADGWRLADDSMMMCGEGWEAPVRGLLEMDPRTHSPAYLSGDHCGAPWHSKFVFKKRGKEILRISNVFTRRAREGNTVVLTTLDRKNTGIFISDSHDIAIEDITVYHAPGMALIAQRTHGVRVTRMKVRTLPRSGRMFSAAADATHFVNCGGSITIEDCLFEQMHDDSVNVHGIYLRIEARLGARFIRTRLVHSQQHGVSLFGAGDTVGLVRHGSMLTAATARIVSVRRINSEISELELDRALPKGIGCADAVENLSWAPDLAIRGCISRRNRARSFLLQTPGRVRIEKNTFSSGGAGIQMGAEAQYWFESGAVRDVSIMRNRFVDCGYGLWGDAAIDIAPGTAPDARGPRFHRSVSITDNLFRMFDTALLYARDVDGLVFERNRFERTHTYPDTGRTRNHVRIECCSNVRVAGNQGRQEEIRIVHGSD